MTAPAPVVPEEAVILCEGYDDRSFIRGALLALGCTVPRAPIADRQGKPVKPGQFYFHSRTEGSIRLVQCGGFATLLAESERRIRDRNVEPFSRLVVVVDDDEESGVSVSNRPKIEALLRRYGGSRGQLDVTLPSPAASLSGRLWSADPASVQGVPSKQTLERIVCIALQAVAPGRAIAVHEWLGRRPDPVDSPRAFSWSYMAGGSPTRDATGSTRRSGKIRTYDHGWRVA